MRARPLFLRTVFQINFFGFPNRTVKTQIQKRISQRRNPFSDFAYDCRSEMRILKSKSRFPNRTHPKNNHAFFLRSFVLVVCLFVCIFVFSLQPQATFLRRDSFTRYWISPTQSECRRDDWTFSCPHSLALCLSHSRQAPLCLCGGERPQAALELSVFTRVFWEELILILIFPLPYLFQLQSAGRWSWLDLVCGRAVEHVACCAHHQPKRRTLYHAATRTAGENEKINSHQVIRISVLTNHGDFR